MKAQLLIQPTPTQDEPTRHVLYLKIGNQSFEVERDLDNREHALWTADQLRIALAKAGADVTKRATFIKRIETS